MENIDKKILLISHNPLSRVNNNGKTLASIFEGVPKDNIYQIYLNMDVPDYDMNCHYLQLNEKQILHSVLKMKNVCCQEITPTPEKVSSATINVKSFGIHSKRLLREGIWKISIWKSQLKRWLTDKQFDVVFFMAGDGIFAYDVYRLIMKNITAKGCIFFTDDYIIGKTSHSPIARLRRNLLRQKITQTLPLVKQVYVISDEMKAAYQKLLNVNSCVIRNFSVEKKGAIDRKQTETQANYLTMVYAGGLHYNRWKVLEQIANVLKDINYSETCKCYLKVYSSQNISKEIIDKIDFEGASKFCGAASASKISEIYADADILIHVESFEKKSIASTKYSFSTKIPEYLSAGKCVLAVGPLEVASVQYLSSFACVINDKSEISPILKRLITDAKYRELIKSNCAEFYEKDFSRQKQEECLKYILDI